MNLALTGADRDNILSSNIGGNYFWEPGNAPKHCSRGIIGAAQEHLQKRWTSSETVTKRTVKVKHSRVVAAHAHH
ncbi:hypothetical protein E3U43_007982 [Larimichthys crocea]|uniref:Uncharacterized protein n=1 Tax=Larimichthys crocea TaxID=215358 RepID=A0ACD3Q5N5_LARCR|nr:hypothetical protein E3U43_007982 [Larimichthys crocea]